MKVDALFQSHKLNDTGLTRAKMIGAEFDSLLDTLKKNCPEGRELSIVKTKLEEACFFAKKSVAQLAENQLAE